MKDWIFKPHYDGYLWVRGNGKVIYFDKEMMAKIHECCHELEQRKQEAQMMVCNNPCRAGVSSFCFHSVPHEKNKHCPINEDCTCTSGGKIARCIPHLHIQKEESAPEKSEKRMVSRV